MLLDLPSGCRLFSNSVRVVLIATPLIFTSSQGWGTLLRPSSPHTTCFDQNLNKTGFEQRNCLITWSIQSLASKAASQGGWIARDGRPTKWRNQASSLGGVSSHLKLLEKGMVSTCCLHLIVLLEVLQGHWPVDVPAGNEVQRKTCLSYWEAWPASQVPLRQPSCETCGTWMHTGMVHSPPQSQGSGYTSLNIGRDFRVIRIFPRCRRLTEEVQAMH